MKQINPNNPKQETSEQSKDLDWVKVFRPPQSLRLTIDTRIKFDLRNKGASLSRIDDWMFFVGLLGWLSDIDVQIRLGKWSEIGDWGKYLQYLLKSLRAIKNIKIEIWGKYGDEYKIGKSSVALFESVLFGELASFTEITQLTFKSK